MGSILPRKKEQTPIILLCVRCLVFVFNCLTNYELLIRHKLAYEVQLSEFLLKKKIIFIINCCKENFYAMLR